MAGSTIGGAVPDEVREATAAYLDGRCSTHDFVAQIVALLTEANVDAVMAALPREQLEDWVAVAATEIPRPGDDGASDQWTAVRPSAEAFAAFDGWLARWNDPRWPARCGCGKQYTEERWKTLRLVGEYEGLEMRVCVCGSTTSVPLATNDEPPAA